MNNTAFMLGLICGVLLVFLAAYFIFRARRKEGFGYKNFDERQKAIRGKGYFCAYITLIGYTVLYALVDALGLVAWELGIVLFIGILLSLLVHIIYSIYKDAYFTAGDRPKSFIWVMSFVAAVNFVPGLVRRISGSVSGPPGYEDLNLITGIFCLICIMNLLIKCALDKRETEQ